MNHFSPIQNSIRHNLSLHSRFVRIQNEGTGKSSWWMLNPEGGKNGKSPRRRATSMDNSNKFVKSRGRAAKKKVSAPELNLHRYFSQMFFLFFLILLNLDYMYSVFLCSTISRWLYRKGLKEEQAAPVPSTLPGLEVQTPTATKILTTGKPLGRVPALMPVL